MIDYKVLIIHCEGKQNNDPIAWAKSDHNQLSNNFKENALLVSKIVNELSFELTKM